MSLSGFSEAVEVQSSAIQGLQRPRVVPIRLAITSKAHEVKHLHSM
jgi:hypothetical protein